MASAHGPGPVPFTAQREQYALLIASGVKLSAGVELAAQAAVLRYCPRTSG
jgi:hypothetical protein